MKNIINEYLETILEALTIAIFVSAFGKIVSILFTLKLN